MDKNKANVPKIRFPGFTGEWERRKLGEMCDEFQSGKSIKSENISDVGKYPVFGGNGFRGYANIFNHDGLYALIGRQGALCGNMNISTGRAYFTEHAVVVKANRNNETKFLFYLLAKMDLGRYSGQSAQPGLAVNKLIEIHAIVPNCEEQTKIGCFLTDIDKRITLYQRKLNHLQTKKKGLLQKMFPKDGEAAPKLRFPGFTDAWEQRGFPEIFAYLQNNSFSRADLNYERGSVQNVHYGDILIKFGEVLDLEKEKIPFINNNELKFNSKSLLQDGDIIIADAAEDESVGKCCEIRGLSGMSIVSGLHTIPCRSMKKFATGYLGYYMNSVAYHNKLLPLIQGTKISSISKSALQNTYISYPVSEEEQRKIGAFFTVFDNLITLHQRKLTHLQEQKKALLQQMFV